MKTMNSKSLLVAGACALALSLGTAAYASDDGIAASPKVRQMLNERRASAAPAAVTVPKMACPKCADVFKTEVNRQAKGAQFLAGTATTKVIRHTCAGCETTIATKGFGKTKHSVATHKCTADVANNLVCCATN